MSSEPKNQTFGMTYILFPSVEQQTDELADAYEAQLRAAGIIK